MIRKLWRSKAAPAAIPEDPQAAKARLVLELINKKLLPPPSGDFTKELQRLAAKGTQMPAKSRNAIMGSLDKHLSDYSEKPRNAPPRPAASKPKPPAPPAPRPKPDLSHIDKLAGLEDQHPAVIQQRLAKLDPQERRAQLARLSGETARHVSLLLWQQEADARRS